MSPLWSWVSIIVGAGIITWFVTWLVTTPMSGREEEFGVYRGEDLHLRVGEPTTVRVMSDIDMPLTQASDVGELDGDRDVAPFWGTHPSTRPTSRP